MITRKTLLAQARDGIENRYWYRDAKGDIALVADLMGFSRSEYTRALAAFSPRVQVLRSVKLATEFCSTGRKPAGSLDMSYRIARQSREDLNGPKTEAFRRCLSGCQDSLVLDVWTCRGLQVQQGQAYQRDVFRRIASRFADVADQLGLTVAECQASQWAGVMLRHGRKPAPLFCSKVVEWLQGYHDKIGKGGQ